MIDLLFNKYIGRVVSWVIAPLLAVALPPIIIKVNDVLNTDLTVAQVTAVAVASVVGVLAVVFQWLKGRWNWELLEKQLLHIEQQGQDIVDSETDAEVPLPKDV